MASHIRIDSGPTDQGIIVTPSGRRSSDPVIIPLKTIHIGEESEPPHCQEHGVMTFCRCSAPWRASLQRCQPTGQPVDSSFVNEKWATRTAMLSHIACSPAANPQPHGYRLVVQSQATMTEMGICILYIYIAVSYIYALYSIYIYIYIYIYI